MISLSRSLSLSLRASVGDAVRGRKSSSGSEAAVSLQDGGWA